MISAQIRARPTPGVRIFFSLTIMSSLSDCPPEIVEVVIEFLQDDLSALKACSQTCAALLSLCRKYIFHSLLISNHPSPSHSVRYLHRWRSSRITLVKPKFWLCLNANRTISEYVHKFAYHISKLDLEDGDVPRVLDQLHSHNVHSFHLIGTSFPSIGMKWAQVPPRLGDALLRVVQSPLITCLALSRIANFPIMALRACVNLTELNISMVDFHVFTVDEQESLTSISSFEVRIPQLQTFACEMYSGQYAMFLLNARHPIDGPLLDFSNVRMLSLEVDRDSDLAIRRAFINATNKLESLQYTGTYQEHFSRRLKLISHSCSLGLYRCSVRRYRGVDQQSLAINVETTPLLLRV